MELCLRVDLTRRFPGGACGVVWLQGWFLELRFVETNTLVLSEIDLEHFFKGSKFNLSSNCAAGRLAAVAGGQWLLTVTGGIDGYEGSNRFGSNTKFDAAQESI
ncbi:hypothetical protein Acr_11g0010870 [Actinidia rufa]|uniref:Uncharacterized protein n=1 Tax=Actinidia rufa TaxID=165716 RepID=A0A7J0FDM0_9ERIC|nr:hypothetical protein Acr_11g0010870 [Actinidia rufa]